MLAVSEAIRSGVDGAATIGRELLLDPSHLAWEYEPELSDLGRLVLEGATPEVVGAWIAVVESDPEFADTPEEHVRIIAARIANVDVADVADEHIEMLRRYRVRSHLALMEGSLPDDLAARLAALDTEFGARPARESWGPTVTSFIGPTSPKSTEGLEAMSDDEMIDYLKEWRAPESVHFGPTPEGLGGQLGVLAERRPERLFALADRLTELSTTYLRHILQGWEQAIRKNGVVLDWEQVIKVILFVAEQPDEGDVQDRFDEDISWRAAHQAAASLLDAALRQSSNIVPELEFRSAIWSAIERLSQSPDPTPVREATGGMDADNVALIRGDYDAAIAAILRILEGWACWYHEPENNGAVAGYLDAQHHLAHLVAVENATRPAGRQLGFGGILMSETYNAGAAAPFYPGPGVWSYAGADGYSKAAGRTPAQIFDTALATSKSWGLPLGIGEFGALAGAGRAQWIKDTIAWAKAAGSPFACYWNAAKSPALNYTLTTAEEQLLKG